MAVYWIPDTPPLTYIKVRKTTKITEKSIIFASSNTQDDKNKCNI